VTAQALLPDATKKDTTPRRPVGRLAKTLAFIAGPFVFIQVIAQIMGDRFPGPLSSIEEDAAPPLVEWINSVVLFFRNEELFGLTGRDVTRAIAGLIDWPLELSEGLLTTGYDPLGLPAIPWVMLVGLAGVLGSYVGGTRLALLGAFGVLYLALFDVWNDSMVTLSTVLVSAPLAVLIGWVLGLIGAKRRWFEAGLIPGLNLAQSLPHFAYFIPIAVFVGISHKAGVIATVLFAIPPMAKLTMLGLRGVSPEVIEAGLMSGSTPRQMLWKVEMPAARPALMVGVNQVIMQCLGMTVLAAFVGTRGLGAKLLNLLQSLRIGAALERGLAVVLLAIVLDRLSQAAARRRPEHQEEGLSFWRAHPHLVAGAAVVIVAVLAGLMTDWADTYPEAWTFSTSSFWDSVVDYVQVEWRGPLGAFKDFVSVQLLLPMKNGFLAVPWIGMVALVGAIGWKVGGVRLAAIVAGLLSFIAIAGFWTPAVESLYLAVAAVLVSVVVGVPLGVFGSRSDRLHNAMQVVLDTFQTLPSFIYLIPVVMLFQVGPVAALTAIVFYSTVPAIRYTMLGMRNVPEDLLEAAATSGCTKRQTLWKVRFPLALPEIMLGVNQVLMFSLLMVMIAAFIGGIDGLGDEILIALRDQDAGKGLVVGLSLAFLGIAADQIIGTWSRERKRQLGLD
jgi:glycine betaine/proline transport system permease protein